MNFQVGRQALSGRDPERDAPGDYSLWNDVIWLVIPDLRASWLTLALCLVFPGTANAQRDTLDVEGVSPQLWMDYDPSVQVSPRVQLFGDFGARTEIESGG